MRGHRDRGGQHRRPAIVAVSGVAMLASLAGACLATSRAIEPGTGNGPLPPPLPAGPSAAAPSRPRSFTVVATGEIAPAAAPAAGPAAAGPGTGAGGLDYRRPLRSVLPLISGADLAICHIATPLAPASAAPAAPAAPSGPAVAAELAGLGYDTCSTASGRALVNGAGGVTRTLQSLDRAGLRHAGTARSAAAAATPTIMTVKGVRVAHLSYAAGRSGSRLSRTMPWLANRIDPGRILAAARRARRAGARVVIVSLDWGGGHRRAATPAQLALARRLLAAKDIDLIVGPGAGVVQPFGRAVNGKFVAYGLGRLLAGPRVPAGAAATPRATPAATPEENAGIIARFTFGRGEAGWRVTRAEFVPIYTDPGPPARVLDVAAALADPRLDHARRELLRDVLRETTRTVYSRGVAPILTGAHAGPIPGVIRKHGRPGS